jgi:glycosyltransferase involved in cell wall biosynthesis
VGGADVVVVENLASLPFNPTAIDAIAALRLARPTVFHHHDLGWQREQFREWAGPPTGDAWAHVTINDLSREELRTHGIEATTMRNRFAIDARGDRNAGRRVANVDADDRLVLQPTRAIARKNVPAALALAEQLGATFWIPGDAEEGYGPTLDALVAEHSRTRVVRGGLAGQGISIDDAYQASDLVAFPSTWEGFGNATIESAVHRKPLAIGDYPVARELRAYGFEWFDHSDVPSIEAFLDEPDHHLLDHNAAIAGEHFDLAGLPAEITALIERAGWRL